MNANNSTQNGYTHKGDALDVDDATANKLVLRNPQDLYRRHK